VVSDIEAMVSWLRDTLDSDERAATAATPGPWFVHDTYLNRGGYTATVLSGEIGHGELRAWLPTMRSDVPWDDERNVWNDAAHIVRHDPAHVLNVVAAHRAIIDMYEEARATHGSAAPVRDLAHASKMGKVVALGKALQALAAGYSDRDGYRTEWGQR
jgi:hypothetical protein